MEENISKFVIAIVAIFLLFIFPLYSAYEKKDDISYALALKYTQEFVDRVRSKGYITEDLYYDYVKSLTTTGNMYSIEMEHSYVNYEADNIDGITGNAVRNVEVFGSSHILSTIANNNIYTMNANDNFNVKIRNTNITPATLIYNIVTINMSKNNVRLYVDYGGNILAEKWYSPDLKYNEYGVLDKEENGLEIHITEADVNNI